MAAAVRKPFLPKPFPGLRGSGLITESGEHPAVHRADRRMQDMGSERFELRPPQSALNGPRHWRIFSQERAWEISRPLITAT